ncbi:MAG: lysophospholipid acyltransferase family protein [Candidatus Binatia bacterium]
MSDTVRWPAGETEPAAAPAGVARAGFELTPRHRAALAVQRTVGYLLLPLYGPLIVAALRWVMQYRFADLASIRRQFRQILDRERAPLVICPNHLTMIDSAIVAWALAPWWRYLIAYRLLPWNMPERTLFAGLGVRIVCYLAKCLPIRRGGDRTLQRVVFAKAANLLRRGELLLVFPEGRRSRTGSVDGEWAADGIGRLIKTVPGCRVLCVYVRADNQTQYSVMPKRGARFTMAMRLLDPPAVSGSGVRANREITAAILGQLAAMEREARGVDR